MLKFVDDAKLKFGVWNRERKERAEEKRSVNRRRYAEHGAPLLWIWLLVFIAVSTLIGSTWMLLVFIAGSVGQVDWAFDWRAGNDGEPGRWNWFAEANIHAIYGGGLFLFCLGIATFNAVWLHIRHYLQGLFRNVATGIGIAIALFMISGAIVTQQWGTDARTRDQVINANTAQAGVASVNAEISAIETEMARLCAPNLTTYQAQACRSGELAWTERMATARTQRDYQLAGIERALADARQGDRWRARLLELRQQAAVASVETVEAEAATVTATGFMATFSRFLEEIRKPFIAVLGELLAMTMFGVALAAWRSRVPAVDVERSGWADEGHRIEDLRDQEPIAKGTATMQTVMEEEDLATGEKKRMIKPKPYWRTVKKGKKQRIEIPPEMVEDENGVYTDGGNRTASSGVTLGGRMESAATVVAEPDVTQDVQAERTTEHEYAGDAELQTDEHDKGGGASDDREGHDASPRFDGGVDDAFHVQSEPPIDFEELAAQVAEEVNEAVAVDTTPAGSPAEESLPAEYEEAPDELAATTSDTHHEPQPEQREDRLLAPPSVAAE